MASSSSSAEVDPRVALQAAEWLVRLQTEGHNATHQAELMRWRASDPRHEMAWQRAERVLGKLSASRAGADINADNRLGALSAAALRESSRTQRRMATRLLAAAIVAGPVGYASWRLAPWNEWSADMRTATGERRETTLADGSKIQLDTGSAVDLAFSSSERRLILSSGAVWIQTATDHAQRPFLVQTSEGTARALGTRYTVRMEPRSKGAAPSSLIAVQQGAVELIPANSGMAVRLDAGSQTRMTAEHIDLPEPASLAADGWAYGVLYAEKTPLSVFAAELSRYRPGMVRCDPAVAALPVSGAFQLRNTDEALMALAASLPVRILQRTRYWVTIAPR
ncbi:FecR domain-containing protein [Comamonas sp.]|uniref:FecR domain-containing protein n=1 Tax=Comamonas sp. TaxID=34028 RepID=UPI003A8FA9F8